MSHSLTGEEDMTSEIDHFFGKAEAENITPGACEVATDPVSMRVVRSDSPVSSVLSMRTDHSKEGPPNLSVESSVRDQSGLVETHFHPQCRKRFGAPSRSENVTCDVCTEGRARAVKFCLTCSASYCEDHIRHHYTAEEYQMHKLEDITEDLVFKHRSTFMKTKQDDMQSPVAEAQSLLQGGQKQGRMCKPTSSFQMGPWIKGIIIVVMACVLAMTLLFIFFIVKDSGRRPAPHDLRIVLVGKIGAGKSATGNTILGRKVFKEGFSPKSVTLKCETHSQEVAGRNVTVIDTPGIFDTSPSFDQIKREMVESMNHLFLLVIRLGRFTEEERASPKSIQGHFGEEALQYTMVLFTGGDELSTPVEEYLRESSGLQELVNSCGGGCHVFNNKDKNNRIQVTELLEKIEAVLFKMTGYHHASKIIQQMQSKIQNEEETKREELSKSTQMKIVLFLAVVIGVCVVIRVCGKRKIRNIKAQDERQRKESGSEIQAEEEGKREESQSEIKIEERKTEQSPSEIKVEEERKRGESRSEIKVEEERKREESQSEIKVEEGKMEKSPSEIKVEEERQREETPSKIILEEEKKEEAEREMRVEEERKREETPSEIKVGEERKIDKTPSKIILEEEKKEEAEREMRVEEERKREETPSEIKVGEERKIDETPSKIILEEEKKEEAEREMQVEEERKREETPSEISVEEERKMGKSPSEIKVDKERKMEKSQSEIKVEEERRMEKSPSEIKVDKERNMEKSPSEIKVEEERKMEKFPSEIKVEKEWKEADGLSSPP